MSGLFANINSSIDIIMIGLLLNSYSVGLYTSAYKIINYLIIVITIIFKPIYPNLIYYFNKNMTIELNKLISSLYKYVLLLFLPLGVGGVVLRNEIIDFLYGSAYSDVGPIFGILIFFIFILSIREIFGYQLSAYGMQKKYMKVLIFSAGTNIILNSIFIPKYGILAAGLNTLASELINLFFSAIIATKVICIKPNIKETILISLLALFMVIAIFILKSYITNLLVLLLLGVTIYAIFILIFNVINLDELRSILKQVKI